jgi:hypothetical protein
MADFDGRMARGRAGAPSTAIDEGLRNYMLGIYNYMAGGVALTGVIAYLTAGSPAMTALIYGSALGYVVMFAPLAFVLVMSFGMNRLSVGALQLTFWGFASVMGLSLSSIFLVYTDTSIAKVFFISATAFAALSLYGYTTKKDLSAMGTFMFMGLIGILIAMVVNFFLQSSALEFAISVIGVLIFAGLTAWDTQRLKLEYDHHGGVGEAAAKGSIMGALSLYLDFINMFLFLLRLLGSRE